MGFLFYFINTRLTKFKWGGVKIKIPKYYFCNAYPLGVRDMKKHRQIALRMKHALLKIY